MIRDNEQQGAPLSAHRAERAEPVPPDGGGQSSARSARSARSTPAEAAPSGLFARVALDIAAEVEAAETALKQQILDAARAGDCAQVISIIERWMVEPPTAVVSHALIDASDRR